MTQTECTAGFIVPNDIAGIQTRKIPVDEDQGIFLQQQIKQLLAEKWLILRKQNDSADAGVDTFLQQPVFQRRIEALEKVTDILQDVYDAATAVFCTGGGKRCGLTG